MRRLLPFVVLALSLTGSVASAGPITLSTTYSQTFGSDTCDTSTTTQTSLSQSCGGSAGVASNVFGHFFGTGLVSVTTVNGLGLHASSDLLVWVTNNLGTAGTLFDPYAASLVSRAFLEDSVAVQNAGTVESGFLRFTFDVTGSVSRTSDLNTLDGFNPNQPGTSTGAFGTGSASLVINGVSASFGVGRTVVLDVPFDFSSWGDIDLAFNAIAQGQIAVTYMGVRVFTDFSNTATLAGTTILDGNKNVIEGATLTSLNGIDYRSDLQVVPEPASVALVSLGLVGVLVARRRRR